MTDRCDACRFWIKRDMDSIEADLCKWHKDDEPGECHRFPPIFNILAAEDYMQEAADAGMDGIGYDWSWRFPVTIGSNGCGEFGARK